MRMLSRALIGGALLWSHPVWADNTYPIAGSQPAERPVGAPVITEVSHDGAWYRQALTGVSRPYPNSLKFLENQGNWYTPFNHPGMPDGYDIRGWHHHQ